MFGVIFSVLYDGTLGMSLLIFVVCVSFGIKPFIVADGNKLSLLINSTDGIWSVIISNSPPALEELTENIIEKLNNSFAKRYLFFVYCILYFFLFLTELLLYL